MVDTWVIVCISPISWSIFPDRRSRAVRGAAARSASHRAVLFFTRSAPHQCVRSCGDAGWLYNQDPGLPVNHRTCTGHPYKVTPEAGHPQRERFPGRSDAWKDREPDGGHGFAYVSGAGTKPVTERCPSLSLPRASVKANSFVGGRHHFLCRHLKQITRSYDNERRSCGS